MVGKQYPIHDELKKTAGIHCAALVVTQNWAHMPTGFPVAAQPDSSLRNGTLTFVRSAGRTYGITCQHVVDHYRSVIKASGDPGSHSMRTMLNGFYIVTDRFVQAKGQFGENALDVAIRELHPGFIDRLGKRCIDLDVMPEPPRLAGGCAVDRSVEHCSGRSAGNEKLNPGAAARGRSCHDH
jgi:hypothetical protein